MDLKNKFADLLKETLNTTQKVVKSVDPQKISETIAKAQMKIDSGLEELKEKVNAQAQAREQSTNNEEKRTNTTSESPLTPTDINEETTTTFEDFTINEKTIPVTELDLPQNIKDALVEANILTLAELQLMTDDELMAVKGIGEKSLETIKETLKSTLL